MPWKASSVMEEKMRFLVEYEEQEQTMTELCQRYQVSRETGYVWLRRYRKDGVLGLCERERAALRHPNQTPAEIERLVLELRQAHMRWGPRKLKRIPGARRAWTGVASGEHDGSAAQEGRLGSAAAQATAHSALHSAIGACRCTEPSLVRRFQGLVPHLRRPADRSADHQRCAQPLSVTVSGSGQDRQRACACDL